MAGHSKAVTYGLYAVALAWCVRNFLRDTTLARKGTVPEDHAGKAVVGKKKKADKYPHFKSDLKKLIKICFTSYTSKESMLLYAFALVLLLRTGLSILVADIDGYMVKHMINRDRSKITLAIGMWIAMALPSSFVNSLIKYLQSSLALSIRTKLSEHTRNLFFANDTYYRIANLEKSVSNPEHALTEDVTQWSDRLAELLSGLGKPMVDTIFYSSMLFSKLGFVNQFLASVVVWESGQMIKKLRPNYADIVQQRGALEAELRFQHTRVITSSEEIAFCRGEEREKQLLGGTFSKITKFTKQLLRAQVGYHTAEDFITKYFWTVVGLVQVAVPLMQHGTSAGDNARYFVTVRRLMIRNGDAVERLMVGIKEVHEFAGFTRRVSDMIRAFEDSGKLNNNATGPTTTSADTAAGVVQFSDDIVVEGVPVVTPTNDVLIDKMNLRLNAGDRVLILGPNGCGKSSLFRILCGLWPMKAGTISKPERRQDLYFLPQKPYLVQGTLRDQLIYPHTPAEMASLKDVTDEALLKILGTVQLSHVVEAHEGGLDAVKEWGEVLSGGEKQRMGLGRVFYHRPKYAILDECSSAINIEAEQVIFEKLVETGMGLITISHRHTLFKFHTKLLSFDGEGHYSFNPDLQQAALDDLSGRKVTLVKSLQGVLRELGEDWPAPDRVACLLAEEELAAATS